MVKPNDRLVLVSSTPCCAYTSCLSTWSSSTGLQGDLILGVASRLYAFSDYPFPNLATQPCRWRDNWYTRGSSIPVLSY